MIRVDNKLTLRFLKFKFVLMCLEAGNSSVKTRFQAELKK